MKIVKPMAVSFSYRAFQIVGKLQLSVTCLIGFRLGEGIRRLVADVALWPIIGEAIGSGVVDEGLPKARGEVLVHGSCHVPGGVATPSSTVCVRIQAASATADPKPLLERRLTVFGDRYWEGTASKGPTDDPVPSTHKLTPPVAFTVMPITWERAFGGPSYKRNPLGRGVDRMEAADGIWRVPLPNVELPTSLVGSSSHRREPACFRPLDLSWPQRQSLAGTYDKRWLEQDFPGYARDTDIAFFSTAPPEQRIDGFFRGDEEYLLENMHPDRAALRGRLPGAAARVLLRRKGSEDVEDVRMRLDTLVFLPDKEMGILVFRGTTPVAEDDAADIAVALAAAEDMDAPRSTEHYVQSMRRRLDKRQSSLLSLNEDDLLPSFSAGTGLADLIGKLKDPTKEMRERVFKRAIERMRKKFAHVKPDQIIAKNVPDEAVRKQLAAANIPDPDELITQIETQAKPPFVERLERLPDPADPKDLAEYVAALEAWDAWSEEQLEKARDTAKAALDRTQKKVNEQLERARKTLEQSGSADPRAMAEIEKRQQETDELVENLRRTAEGKPPPEDAPPTGEGPPKPRGPIGAVDTVREAHKKANREPEVALLKAMEDLEAKLGPLAASGYEKHLEMYRGSAHYMPAARLLDAETRARARRTVMELRAAGKSFAELDWTRYDLSALDLRGADCRKTLLEGADLTRTSFTEADLSGAVLAHGVLRETCFDGATLEATNLGSTVVDGASFAGANLRKAVFARSKLVSACFRGADLTKVDWLEAKLGALDFEGAIAEQTKFLYEIKAEIPKRGQPFPDPVPSDLTRCRFPKARLKKAAFLHSILSGVDFSEADLDLVVLVAAKADGASFRGARMRKLQTVMGCSLEGADFSGADLSGAFLRGSSLRGANFAGACLDGADLSECDLTGANLPGVQARETFFIRSDLTGANLPGADLMNAMMMKAKLHGADISKSNLFAANLGLIRLDDATKVRDANLKRALMLPKAKKTT